MRLPKPKPDGTAPAASEPQTPMQQVLLKRRRGRRVDFKTIQGVLRESTRCYLDLLSGAISLEAAEVRGRAIARHREILSDMEEQRQLVMLNAQLKALNSGDTREFERLDDEKAAWPALK